MVFHQSISNFNVGNFFLSADSVINFYKSVYLKTDNIIIQGSISASQTPSSILMIISKMFFIDVTATISDIEFIALKAIENLVTYGVVRSFKQTCTYNLYSEKFFFNFADKNLQSNSFEKKIFQWSKRKNASSTNWFLLFEDLLLSNYTIILMSDKTILLDFKGSVSGARIGVFAVNLSLEKNTQISTTAFGCSADSGPGKGQSILHEDNYCGGMGGSYGGYKGYGLGVILENDSKKESELCQSYARQIDSKEQNLPYGGLDDPNFEGSGGGSGADNSRDKLLNKGGSGGGIIILGIYNNLTNNGVIESNGESTDGLCINTKGPGAGAGGSIQVNLKFLAGTGIITANGGNSGFYCGEGGGGRIKVFFLSWSDESLKSNLTQYWSGKILVDAGQRLGKDPIYKLNIQKFRGSFGSKIWLFL